MNLSEHKERCEQLDADLAAATADLKAEVSAHAERIAGVVRLARLCLLADRKRDHAARPSIRILETPSRD